jgi:TPR repeat protein
MKAAEENDAEALDRVGGAYLHGAGVEQNLAKAVEYYKKSIVADGFAEALLDLGLAYLKGEGVPQNAEHGFSLMIRAAKQGHAAAQYNMGYLYRNGVGVESNMDEAIRWYRLSAAQDYEQAIETLKELNIK